MHASWPFLEATVGYHIWMEEGIFRIPKEKEAEALDHVKAAASLLMLGKRHFSWVDVDEIARARTMEEAMKAMRWAVGRNEDGEIDEIDFTGEKSGGDEAELLSLIAPFVPKGCYITMRGEEHEMWRWYFDGQECIEVDAEIRVIWPVNIEFATIRP